MNKGFTLVELLAILFILGIIIIISVPNIINTNEKSKEEDINQFKKTVENAAEVYVETHLEDVNVINLKNDGTDFCIPKDALINDNLLNPNLENPESSKSISEENFSVLAQKQYNEIKYEYKSSNCS